MTLKTLHSSLACVVFSTLLISFNARAQEGKPILDPETASKESRQDNDPVLGESTEGRSNRTLTSTISTSEAPVVVRDSEIKAGKPIVKPAEKLQKEEEKAQKKEGDPLSFNFLYYIIEKFKLSDFVE